MNTFKCLLSKELLLQLLNVRTSKEVHSQHKFMETVIPVSSITLAFIYQIKVYKNDIIIKSLI
eukprot:c39468_g1_i1 orf=125-313(+)